VRVPGPADPTRREENGLALRNAAEEKRFVCPPPAPPATRSSKAIFSASPSRDTPSENTVLFLYP